MVRDAERRKRRYETNVDAEQVGRAFKAQKPIMLDQEKTYFPQISLIEQKTKKLCEAQGIPTYEIAQYINYAREMYSKARRFSQDTLANEAQYLLNKWQSRGLRGSKLVEIAKLFGVTPTPGPWHEHPYPIPTEGILDKAVTLEKCDFEPLTVHYSVGEWYTNPFLMSPYTSRAWSNSLEAVIFPVFRDTRWDRIGMRVFVGADGARIRLGIYKSLPNYKPGALIVDSGIMECSLPGDKVCVINEVLTRGIYYYAWITNSDLLEVGMWDEGSFNIVGNASLDESTHIKLTTFWRNYSFNPLPDPFGTPDGMDSYGVHVGLRLAEIL